MKLITKLSIGGLLIAGIIGSVWFFGNFRAVNSAIPTTTQNEVQTNTVIARAFVHGAPGSGISGEITFSQIPCSGCPSPGPTATPTDPGFVNFPEPTVQIVANINGPSNVLTPGAHGMHIHEVGLCEAPGFTTAGGHFDPGPFQSSNPVDANHPFHMGDIPNLIVDQTGHGVLQHTTSRVTLSPGPLSLFDLDGSAVIVHLNPDRGITGTAGASGGPRLACGVIQLVSGNPALADEK